MPQPAAPGAGRAAAEIRLRPYWPGILVLAATVAAAAFAVYAARHLPWWFAVALAATVVTAGLWLAHTLARLPRGLDR